MRLKFPSHLNICWEESKLTGKVTWINSLAAMEVVRFTWKPSQTTWIQLKLKPLSPTSLRASPWSFGQKTSEIRIQTLAQAPPLQCTLRNWHEVFVHTNQLTSFKAKIGSKSSTKTSSQASKNMVLFLLLHICRVQRIHGGHDASFLIFSHSFLEEVGLPL